MSEPIQTPVEGTDLQEPVAPIVETPQDDQGLETPKTPAVEEQPDEGNGDEPTPPQPPQVDYKQKFVDSQREAILLNERNKQKEAQLNKLTSKDAPSDDEMRATYSWWDQPNVDDSTRDFYREQVARDKQVKATQNLAMTALQKLEFQEKLDDFIEEPPAEFARLRGKEADFKRFAKRKDNINLPLETLAKAFLFDASEDAPPPHVPDRTPGLEKGSGGPRTAPTHKKITLEEAAVIHKTDWKRYKALSDAGQIEEFEG